MNTATRTLSLLKIIVDDHEGHRSSFPAAFVVDEEEAVRSAIKAWSFEWDIRVQQIAGHKFMVNGKIHEAKVSEVKPEVGTTASTVGEVDSFEQDEEKMLTTFVRQELFRRPTIIRLTHQEV